MLQSSFSLPYIRPPLTVSGTTIKIQMAPQLHLPNVPLTTSQVGLGAVTLLFCAFALFMCASHSRKWRHWKASACYGFYDHDPVIQLNNDHLMLGVGDQGIQDASVVSGEQQSGPVWQKNILMGGKCQLPDFSGVIIYDAEGNVVPPAKNARPLLTWK